MEIWTSHMQMRRGIQPLNGEQWKLFPYPNGPWTQSPWWAMSAGFQEWHEAPTKDFKLKRHQHVHWTNAFPGSTQSLCWMLKKHETCFLSWESSFHIHQPIPFNTQAHDWFILSLVLSHKHYLHEICKSSRKYTLLDVLHNDSYMIASWLMDFGHFLNTQIRWTYLYSTFGKF